MIGGAWIRSPAAPFLAGCAVLTVIIALEWLPGGSAPVLRPAQPAHATAVTKADETRDTGEWSDTILERPLFSVNRKPPKGADGPAAAAGAPMPRLAGIMISAYGKRAIFMPEGGKPLVLAEGAAIDNGTIRSIATDRVIVSSPAGDTVLRPTLDKQRPNTGPATGISPFLPPGGAGQPNFLAPGGFQPNIVTPPPTPDDNTDTDNAPPPAPPHLQPPFRPFAPGGPGMRPPMGPRGRE